ncbi:MAG: histidine phosphatase family protein [Proteobacteria bacterium]|nr:MAG: histidine phosphatase family protein [Pseudomonadota bacterium]
MNIQSLCLSHKLRLLFICLMLWSLGPASAATFYVLRHAEKQTGDDPALTEQGQQRAQRLANLLSNADIQAIYSSHYQRTRQTAEPIAEIKKLPITQYDPKALNQFAQKLLSENKNAVIIGHSNTTPQLVRMLSQQPIPDMDEKTYDLIYQVVTFSEIAGQQSVVNVLSSQD